MEHQLNQILYLLMVILKAERTLKKIINLELIFLNYFLNYERFQIYTHEVTVKNTSVPTTHLY